MFTVTVTDSSAIDAFNRIIAFGEDPSPALRAIGEGVLLPQTKQLFALGQDPYGNAWAPNADTTLRNALQKSGKNFTKKGALSKRGVTFLANKKPLIGATLDLSTQFNYAVIDGSLVTLSSPMAYAAAMNFGAKQGEFGRDKRNHPIPWGDIPARQFFPDKERGLPPAMQDGINNVLRIALQNAASGNS